MNQFARLRQYIGKASFSSAVDRLAAMECIDAIEAESTQTCRACNGSGWVVRDTDIGTERECGCCNTLL